MKTRKLEQMSEREMHRRGNAVEKSLARACGDDDPSDHGLVFALAMMLMCPIWIPFLALGLRYVAGLVS